MAEQQFGGGERMGMDIVLATDPDRDNLFAEVHEDGQVWAEVIYDDAKQKYMLTIFPPGSGPDPSEFMEFDYQEAVGYLQRALSILVERGFPDPEKGKDRS